MQLSRRNLLLAGCALIAGCKGGSATGNSGPPPVPAPPPPPPPPPPPTPPPPPVTKLNFSFAAGTDGFTSDYADYSPGMETGDSGIQFVSEFRRLPPPLDNRFGLLLGGTNRSADLFMFIWREVTGLAPNRLYRIDVDVTIATNVGKNCAGAGSSPGEGVVIKAGASPALPAKAVINNKVRVNFEKDKNPLPVGGDQVATIGDFANSTALCSAAPYELKTLSSTGTRSGFATSDSSGRLWLVIGTDSGFEGRTEIYYLEGSATFTPS